MEKSEKTKENIIFQATALIKEHNGDTEKVTVRRIAERSGVSAGLINHYFGSKDGLIELCVQNIIGGVIRSFQPGPCADGGRAGILKHVAKQVVDFLMENRQLSRISILGDLKQPREKDNTMGAVWGFAGCMSGRRPAGKDLLDAFLLTAVLQGSFLRKDVLQATLGVDFYDKAQRDLYIEFVVEKLTGSGGSSVWTES